MKLKEFPLTALEMEHVTLGLRTREKDFIIGNYSQLSDMSHLRWTVDYEKDLEYVKKIYSSFQGRELTFDFQDLMALLASNPSLTNEVSGNLRNVAIKEKYD